MYIERSIGKELIEAARHFPVVVLTGARQTGKTTVLQKMFPDHSYVSLDLPSQSERAERDPESFLTSFPGPLIVDEVQCAPGLFRHLKSVVDKNAMRGADTYLQAVSILCS